MEQAMKRDERIASSNGLQTAAAGLLSAPAVLLSCLLSALPAFSQTQAAVEYYYPDWDYYFETSFPDEIAVLDGGAFGGVWKRTGQTFTVRPHPWLVETDAASSRRSGSFPGPVRVASQAR